MKAKDKAKELVEKFLPFQTGTIDDMVLENFKESNLDNKSKIVAMMEFSKKYKAKQCALICVDECLKIERSKDMDFSKRNIEYWQEVKKEIELL